MVDSKSFKSIRYKRRASTDELKYWVVYAFLNVFESAVNAVYWFREFEQRARHMSLMLMSIAFYYTFKFVLILWMALPQTGYIFRDQFQLSPQHITKT